MERLDELKEILQKCDEDKRRVISPLLTDIVFIENRLTDLRQLPHIRVHPSNPSRQEITPAGKQYKEMMQAYLNAIKVVQTMLYRTDTNAADELLEKLSEFE